MDSLFAVTVGTSIGGAFIEKGHILHGACRSAGEIAYMRVPAGRLHDVASATYLCREMACKKAADPEKVDGRTCLLGPSGRCHGSSGPRYILPESGRWPCQYRLPVQSRWHRPRRRHHGPRGYPEAEAGSSPDGAIAGHDAAPKGLAFAKRQNDAGMLGALYLLLHRKGSY